MNATTIQGERPRALHVFKRDDRWRLVREGDAHVADFRTQADAVKSGAQIARAEHGVLVIYDQDGRLQSTRRYTEVRGLRGTPPTKSGLRGSR
jgi:hypothetical protein